MDWDVRVKLVYILHVITKWTYQLTPNIRKYHTTATIGLQPHDVQNTLRRTYTSITCTSYVPHMRAAINEIKHLSWVE